jgi:hypothetical protein
LTGAGATAEVISNCTPVTPVASPYCGYSGQVTIRVSGGAVAFNLTVTAYTNTVNIGITENSGTTNNDGILCEGSNLTLNANPTLTGGATVTSYEWSSGQVTQGFTLNNVTTANSGIYTVTVTDSGGCTSSSQVTVTVNPLPTASIVETDMSGDPNDGEICNGGQATLTASGGTSYQWSNSVNTAINTVSPTTTTTYTVTVTDSNGCTDTEDFQIIVNPLPTVSLCHIYRKQPR